MKQLSIIITYHNETPDQVRRAFASVTMQVDVDFSDIEVAPSLQFKCNTLTTRPKRP
ncbi:hypothetical protein ACFQ41_10995 [Lacticaseibacillus suilingensis]|uniref:Uncharacterized protein n=1 Tax=Lacticaseibacillus suilingensis TaxID=2799577 RepID=A0ABW4BJ34_9LACO|nr:hypothetical protein [Lacticaseibacillus suilingensis]